MTPIDIFSLVFLVLWFGACAFFLCQRMRAGEKPLKSMYLFYLAASFVLGILIVFCEISHVVRMQPYADQLHIPSQVRNWRDWLREPVSWCYFIWCPVSVIATYFAPRKLCILPILFVVTNVVMAVCTWRPWWQEPPDWETLDYIVIAAVFAIGALSTFVVAVNLSRKSKLSSNAG